jgi:hypothetical protein
MKRVMLLLFLLLACAAPQEPELKYLSVQAGAKTVCEVLADPNSYVGQGIVVKGVYFSTPHQRLLVDDDCPEGDFAVRESLDLDNDPEAEAIVDRFGRKHPTVRIPVVYSGIFKARAMLEGCSLPGCYDYSLEESQLLAAFPRIAMPLGK